jgi:peptidoglycan/xylan/chitin deacetylase (PgdA/CDA1 family)
MPKKPLLGVLILLLWCLAPAIALAADDATILIYHRFGDSRYPTTNVSTEAFAEQMDFLRDNGYTVLPLAQLVTLLKTKAAIPAKSVVITIDDAYASVYENAWPILKKHGYPFTVFVYTKGVDQNFGDYMNWTQLRELQGQGVDLQDHSFGHKHLAFQPKTMDEVGYRAWISGDLVQSMALFSRELGDTPRYFAVPYGEYNQVVVEEATALGYEAVLTQDPGAVGPHSDPFYLPRQPILGDEWASLPHFEKVLKLADFPVADLSPQPRQLADALVGRYQVRMINPDDYIAGSYGFWVSGLGWHPGQRQGDILSFSTDKPLQKAINRVVVSAREAKGRRLATRTWMLIHPDGEQAGR